MSQPPPSFEEPGPSRFRRNVPVTGGRRTVMAIALALLALAVAAWYFLSRPTLVFTNELAGPVRLAADQGPALTLAPGETVRRATSRGRAMVAQWELVRPVSPNGGLMGTQVRGSIVVPDPSGTIRRSARARGADADYFAPLITNATEELLRVRVNAGLEGSLDCGCAVRPGGKRVFIGYYPLFQNSTVRASARDGRSATFRDLGPSVVTADGRVGLRFEAQDLR
jgi:hypothetical protein